jgi:hypothetical protein
MARSNAERQKAYRDRKRGGPPEGRWAGHVSHDALAQALQVGRTMLFMLAWIDKHAPEIAADIKRSKGKISPIYRRLKAEFDSVVSKCLVSGGLEKMKSDTWIFTCRREDGRFVAQWIQSEEA